MKTSKVKFLVEPEFRARVDEARGLVPLSAWVRDAIERKLEAMKKLPALDVTGEMEEWDLSNQLRGGLNFSQAETLVAANLTEKQKEAMKEGKAPDYFYEDTTE